MTDIRSYFRRGSETSPTQPFEKSEISKKMKGTKRKRATEDIDTELGDKIDPSIHTRKKRKNSSPKESPSNSSTSAAKEQQNIVSSRASSDTQRVKQPEKLVEKGAHLRSQREKLGSFNKNEPTSDTTEESPMERHTPQRIKRKKGKYGSLGKMAEEETSDAKREKEIKTERRPKQEIETRKGKTRKRNKVSEKTAETKKEKDEEEKKEKTSLEMKTEQLTAQPSHLKAKVAIKEEKEERSPPTITIVSNKAQNENANAANLKDDGPQTASQTSEKTAQAASELVEETIEDSPTSIRGHSKISTLATSSATNLQSRQQTQSEATKCSPKKAWNYSWRQYLTRPTPPHKGTKSIPTGQPNCLYGKVFVITGVLDSLEREEAIDLILKYGGEVTKSVAKKTTHALVGLEPGPGKMAQIRARGLPIVDEDGLFEMIRTLPGQVVTQSPTKKRSKSTPKSGSVATSFSSVLLTPSSGSSVLSVDAPSTQLWTEKYRPTSVKEIVGNPGAIKELITWLQNCQRDLALHATTEKKSKREPIAALISGPPGIGKTTAAVLVAKSLGYVPILSNASDERNKASVQDHLQGSLQNRSMLEFWTKTPHKSLLIMDEIDGMSSGDRGGIAELIREMRNAKTPIICICNDRYNPKVRSLANHCKDIRFRRPTVQQILPRMRAILEAENIHLDEGILRRIIESANGDIRQILNVLQLWSVRWQTLSAANVNDQLRATSKNIDLGPWDVVPRLFGPTTESFSDRLDYYFVDTNLVPLMVHEAYLKISDSVSLQKVASAADIISVADTIDRLVYREQKWELQPLHGFLSSVFPGSILQTSLTARLEFPAWFGKNSAQGKYQRLLQELTLHMYRTTWADKLAIRLDYLPVMRVCLTEPLLRDGVNGVDSVIDVMDAYGLNREQREAVIELTELSGSPEGDDESSVQRLIPTQVKTALTRRYNQKKHTTTVLSTTASKKKTKRDSDVAMLAVSNEDEVAALIDEDTEETQQDEQNAAKAALILDGLVTVGGSATKSKPKTKTKPKSKPNIQDKI
jgi:replication factor C subunit 1